MSEIPKVLLLGDSIRMSYQPHVARLLEGKANVVGPTDNGQYSLYTLSSLDRWLEELGQPDIVHWNNGIHDVAHIQTRCPVQMPIDMYRANLGFILDRLLALTDKVIWAAITPVHPAGTFNETDFPFRNEEIDQYNAVAAELMQAKNVPINDLHALVWARADEFMGEDQLHLSEAGEIACARAVADCMATLL